VNTPDQVQANLRNLRKQNGITQTEISHSTGIGQTEISALENGHRRLTLTHIFKFAKAYNKSPSELLKALEDGKFE